MCVRVYAFMPSMCQRKGESFWKHCRCLLSVALLIQIAAATLCIQAVQCLCALEVQLFHNSCGPRHIWQWSAEWAYLSLSSFVWYVLVFWEERTSGYLFILCVQNFLFWPRITPVVYTRLAKLGRFSPQDVLGHFLSLVYIHATRVNHNFYPGAITYVKGNTVPCLRADALCAFYDVHVHIHTV